MSCSMMGYIRVGEVCVCIRYSIVAHAMETFVAVTIGGSGRGRWRFLAGHDTKSLENVCSPLQVLSGE